MKLSIWVSLGVLLAATDCSKKPDVKENVSGLEKAFPAAVVPISPQPVETGPTPAPRTSDPNTYVSLALSAVHTNDYARGVIALQTVQRMPGVSAQQLMAIESAKQALTADLVARAERGDAKAKADLAAIEKTRSQ